jgi:hypothetical protein
LLHVVGVRDDGLAVGIGVPGLLVNLHCSLGHQEADEGWNLDLDSDLIYLRFYLIALLKVRIVSGVKRACYSTVQKSGVPREILNPSPPMILASMPSPAHWSRVKMESIKICPVKP